MISDTTIQEVRDRAEIAEVIGEYVKLKRNAGCCPFHDEKTASFHVSPQKGIYKCFGCGVSGDSIRFIMEHERKSFAEAVTWLADKYSVRIAFDKAEAAESNEQVEELQTLQKINQAAANAWLTKLLDMPVNNPAALMLLEERLIDPETVIQFQLGYAPDEWRFLTEKLVEKALFKPGEELGLVKSSNGKNYDFYRNRIMFPIHDHRGIIVGFGGRKIEDGNKENPKYLNPIDSRLYKKSQVLYGLYFAQRAIREHGRAILVEGYFDVISLHQAGVMNAVAPCGTAITPGQVKLLRKFTEHVILMYDGDDAGRKATLKAVDLFLAEGFKVEIFNLPDGTDPDSFVRNFSTELIDA